MSNFVIALLFSIGATAWIYNKFAKRSAGNVRPAIIGAAVTGLILFIVVFSLLSIFIKK